MTAKHTPGPWKWEEGTPIVYGHRGGKDCAVAAVDWRRLVWHKDSNCAGRESGANARLIAAAPELLEAAKRLLSWERLGRQIRAEDIAFAQQAIAKAEGAEDGK